MKKLLSSIEDDFLEIDHLLRELRLRIGRAAEVARIATMRAERIERRAIRARKTLKLKAKRG